MTGGRPLRIIVVDPAGFTAHYDANLCYSLGARGHDVCLDTSEFLFEPVSPLAGYRVRNDFYSIFARLPALRRRPRVRQAVKAGLYPLEMLRWAAKVLRAPPHVVHVQWSLLPAWDARVYARLQHRGVRLVYTVHDVRPLPGSGAPVGYGALYRQADALIVHAERSRQLLTDDFGVPARRVHVIPMGGPGAYAASPVSQSEARRRLGLPPGAIYLLFFGLIKPHKGLDLLLEALAVALPQRPELRLLVAGQPMHSWRPYARLIERLGLDGAVDLRLGFVPSDRVGLFFGAADLVVLPYRRSFQSGVVLAAYTYERPVVVTRVGGLPEIVHPGTTGFIAPPDDPDGLAGVLVSATADKSALHAMRASVGAIVHGTHNWEHIASLHEQIYEGEPSGPRSSSL